MYIADVWACDLFLEVYLYAAEKFPLKQYGYPLWIVGSDRKVTFRENTTRIDNFYQPRHLMLTLLSRTLEQVQKDITRQGRPPVRSWLIDCAWRSYNRDPVLLDKFMRVWRNSGSTKKAAVAVARKLAVRMWSLEQTH